MDITKMKKPELLEYALDIGNRLYRTKNQAKEHQDKVSRLRKERNKANENAALAIFAIEAQLRAEFPQMEILNVPPEMRPNDCVIPEHDKWHGFLVCLRDKLSDNRIDCGQIGRLW